MDWKWAIEEERAALQRIAALLLALADLAELACTRSPAVRGFVLWILRLAETVAHDLVSGTQIPISRQSGDTDAMLLARTFRHLAHVLDRQAALAFDRCDGESVYGEPAAFGVCRVLDLRSVIHFAKALALPASAREPVRLAGLPDTS